MALLPHAAQASPPHGVSPSEAAASPTDLSAQRLYREPAWEAFATALAAATLPRAYAPPHALRYTIIKRTPQYVVAKRVRVRVRVAHGRAHLVGNANIRFHVVRRTATAVYLRRIHKPKAPTPTPRLKFGISFGDRLVWLDDQGLAVALDDAKALGMGWVRIDLDWGDVQPVSASSYQWTNFDRVVRAAQARGLSLLPVIAYTPSWARPEMYKSGTWSPAAPADPSQFATFAAAAVRRYAPLGVHTWEIWNEPNAAGFWAPRPDPTAYMRLLNLTAAAMRKADSRVFIVSAGLAPEASDGENISQLEFFASMCALGANRLVDAIGYHPYSSPVAPQNPALWNAWAQIATTNPSLRTILSQYGTPSLPIWATEYGAPTNGPGGLATSAGYVEGGQPYHVDEAFQAELATDSVRAALDTPGVRALFWYTDRDLGTDPSTIENFFGLRRVDGTPKPAFYALQSAIKQWGAYSPTP